MDDSNESNRKSGKIGFETARWPSVILATNSPLKLFSLVVMVCNASFGLAATFSGNPENFIYALHAFLAVVGAFSMIALWSPRSFYSPSELLVLRELASQMPEDQSILPRSNPYVPTASALVVIVIYAFYEFSDRAACV
jgi:hypothetical protein